MTGGGSSKPKMPDPVPPTQIQVEADPVADRTTKKRRRGYLSTILAGGMNERNNTSILRTDKLG